jgi:hypothetical protein
MVPVTPDQRHTRAVSYLRCELCLAQPLALRPHQHLTQSPPSASPRSGTSTASSTAGSALSCGLVSLLLVCPGGASYVRRLPRALSVANLRLLLERLCGVAADRQVLALRDGQGCVSELGSDDSRVLSYYEVQVGGGLGDWAWGASLVDSASHSAASLHTKWRLCHQGIDCRL